MNGRKVGALTLVSMLLISGAFGVTTWRYEHAQGSIRLALSERIARRGSEHATAVFWHEREAINQYVIGHQPTVLREVFALRAEFTRVLNRVDPASPEGAKARRALAANRRLFAQFERRQPLNLGQSRSGGQQIATLEPLEQAVVGTLVALGRIDLQQERAQWDSAARASTQARVVAVFGGILALLAGLGFAFFVSRLLVRTLRQTDVLRETADMVRQTLVEREAAEAALHDREEQLRLSQKMEAVGRLAGGVAHDFNNILLAITGYSELASADVGPDQSRRNHALEQIGIAASRAAGLTAQLLTFSRQKVHQPRVVLINDLVEGLTGMLRPLLGETITLSLQLGEAAWAVKADPGQLEQILTNLSLNSRDALPKGGVITITTVVVEQAKTQSLAGSPPGSYLKLSVSDTGEGMSEKTMAHAFDPFFTTKEPGKGTGLGLATVHGIVSQAGGEVEVSSAPGWGTIVTIYLPLTDSLPDAPLGDEREVPGGFETVLLVEDDEAIRLMLRDALEAQGYRVTVAHDASAAIEAFAASERPFDLLLTDIVMPGMHGRELSEHLRTISPQLKTIYMSGYTQDESLYEGAEAGNIYFLQKPFVTADLARTLRRALGRTPSSVSSDSLVSVS